jgi:hypothetical protein
VRNGCIFGTEGGLTDWGIVTTVGVERMFDPGNEREAAIYRRAYGEAARLVEIARYDHCFGRDFAAGIGGCVESIFNEVKRRMGRDADSVAVTRAVEDAVAGRQPRW